MSPDPDQFREAIARSGLTPPDQIMADGKIHRFASNGKATDRAGWYIFYADGIPAGAYGCWRADLKGSWQANIGRPLTPAEEAAHQAKMDAARREREREEARRHAQAREEAGVVWKASKPAPSDHPYLVKKGVKPHGLRVHEGALVIPMRDGVELHSLQFIGPDGHKRFLIGGRVAGCYFSIGGAKGPALCIAEGYATGASIHEATGYPVVVAFNAGNLLPVAKAMRKRFPELHLIVCGDDDAETPGNPGRTKATEAAQAVSGAVSFPSFGEARPSGLSDFNDLHRHAGAEVVARWIAAAAPGQSLGRGGNSETNHLDKHHDAPDTTGGVTGTEPGLTDLGNAHRFALDHRENVRYCWPWGRWLVWNGRYWSRDETGEIHRLAEATIRLMYEEAARSSPERREALGKWAVKSSRTSGAQKCWRALRRSLGIPIRPEDMDRDAWLLNVLNGTIDLRTGTLRPHAREDHITRGLDVDYDPTAVYPTWERFIREVFAGERGNDRVRATSGRIFDHRRCTGARFFHRARRRQQREEHAYGCRSRCPRCLRRSGAC